MARTSTGREPPGRLWRAVPREVAAVLKPHLGVLADEIVGEIQQRVPEYARPLDAKYTATLRVAVEGALDLFVDLIDDPDASWTRVTDVFREIGRGEAAEGRSLDALQTALRLGARLSLRRLTDESERLDISRRALGLLAEAIFALLDEIADAAAQGYTEAREQVAGETEHRRRRLLDLLLAEPAAAPQAIAELSRSAQWRMPRTVAAVALHEPRSGGFAHPSLPPEVLMDLDRNQPCLIVPDPDGPGRGAMLEGALRDWVAAVGPTVAVEDVAKSLRWAREALALARRGLIAADGLIRCVDHMPLLVIFKDEKLVQTVASARLGPLLRARPRHRERLGRTLLACLQHGFNATEVAARLQVHPQTVRYRVHQLEELFGDQLYDPKVRLEFEIVLHMWLALCAADRSGAGSGEAAELGTVIPLDDRARDAERSAPVNGPTSRSIGRP
ncbi:MAG TPA: helix-turn-helix domain-containing protein [Streptosporangiaceae bacterium]